MKKFIRFVAVIVWVSLLGMTRLVNAQEIPIEPKMPTVMLVETPTPTPTATPTPTPKPTPTLVAPLQKGTTDYGWVPRVIGFVLALILLLFVLRWLLRSFRSRQESKKTVYDLRPEPDNTHKPDAHARTEESNTDNPMFDPNWYKPSHPPTPEQSQVVWTPDLEDTPSSSEDAPKRADDTDPKGSGPKSIAILILALGLSFAQAGTVYAADCTPTGVPKGSRIAKEQGPQFIEVRTTGCKNVTAIGVVPGVEFTNVNFYPGSGRVTAMVTAAKETEVGRYRFKILNNGKEYVSPRNVTISIWGVDAAEVHNQIEEVKTSVTNLAGTVKKGVATLNGQINTLQVETDQVKAEMKAKADHDQMKAEIDKAVKDAVEPMQIEFEQMKKSVSGVSKDIYENTVAVSNAFELIGVLAGQERSKGGWKGLFGGKETTNNPVSITAERLRKLNATRAAALKKAKPEVSDHDDSER